MNIHFKLILPIQIGVVLRLFKETAEKINKMNVDHWQYWNNPPNEKIEWVKTGIQNKEFYFIEDSNQTSVGMVRILKEDLPYWGKRPDKALYVHSLIIREQFNGQGIGASVLQHISHKAKDESCQFLRLDADAKNPKLCQYYENLGFNKVGLKEMSLSSYNLYEKEIF